MLILLKFLAKIPNFKPMGLQGTSLCDPKKVIEVIYGHISFKCSMEIDGQVTFINFSGWPEITLPPHTSGVKLPIILTFCKPYNSIDPNMV